MNCGSRVKGISTKRWGNREKQLPYFFLEGRDVISFGYCSRYGEQSITFVFVIVK